MVKFNKKGEIVLGKVPSLIILGVFGLVLGFFAIKLGLYFAGVYGGDDAKITIIYCKDGSEQQWTGAGVYCGVYADSLRTIEKVIAQSNNNINLDTNLLIIKNE